MINYSAALLIKKSASQLNYDYRYHIKHVINKAKNELSTTDDHFRPLQANSTLEQEIGNRYADMNSLSQYREMCRYYENQYNGIRIYYSVDEVRLLRKSYYFIEHKYVIQPVEDWYLQKCLMQVGFYHALHIFSMKQSYHTAKFYTDEGHASYVLPLMQSKHYFRLNFGGTWYSVKAVAPRAILNFYLTKLISSRNFDASRRFDEQYHHKEWNVLRKFIDYRKKS